MFRPGRADRGYKNFVTNFARALAADPAAPQLTLSRCRSSFICAHLAAGTPVGELLAITGIRQAESLARYARPAWRRPGQGRAAGLGQDPPGAMRWISPGLACCRGMRRLPSPPR